ncbi:MAG: hypothetical protein ACR2O3_15150 [Rhizobiaceae bacterium]
MNMRNWFLKPLLVVAVAMPIVSAVQVQSADAGHRHHRGAIIAGAIIGGAIAYHQYRKHRKYRHYSYGHGYGNRYYSGHRYGKRYYRGHRYGKRYYRGHRYHRHGGYRYYGGYPRAYMNSGIGIK